MSRNIKKLEEKYNKKIRPTKWFLERGITRWFLNNEGEKYKLELSYNRYEQNLYFSDALVKKWKRKNKGE